MTCRGAVEPPARSIIGIAAIAPALVAAGLV
jgi:hypothetical protein